MKLVTNFITILKNGYRAHKKEVLIPSSKTILAILKILKNKGFISDFQEKKINKKNFVFIELKYLDKNPALTDIKLISKSGLRVYVKKDKIPRVLGGLGTVIISTSQGIMDGDLAKKKGLGGELICKVW